MENTRLRSYRFRCPCCEAKHQRLFEYYAKFHGLIKEDEPFPTHVPVSMLERVVLEGNTYESKSLSVPGDEFKSTFRCGNCFEFFKFNDDVSDPVKLSYDEQFEARGHFRPIELTYEKAVLNSVAIFDSIINKNGCAFDEDSKELVIYGERGKEYRMKIDEEFVKAFYADNPMFYVKGMGKKFENQPAK